MFSKIKRLSRRIFSSFPDPICLINLPRSLRDPHVPLGLLSLAAYLENASYPVVILDFDLMHKKWKISFDDHFFERAVDELERIGTPLFGMTSDCSNYPVAIKLSQCLRKAFPKAKIILGGPQATFVPVETLKAFPEIDFIVMGEGEVTLLELLNTLKIRSDPKAVRGIAYQEGGQVIVTPAREYVPDLNLIPSPSFQTFPTKDYIKLSRAKGIDPFLPIEAGRGCPKSCYFCATSRMWQRVNRLKSPERIFQEMNWCEKHFGINVFELVHDNLAANHRFLNEFCHYYIQKGSPFRWSCSASTDRLSRETIALLREAGCVNIFLGIESGSPKIQRIMGKRLNLSHSDEVVKVCLDCGMGVVTAFILGFPEETLKDLDLSLRKALQYRELGAEIRFSQLSPLPGTQIYEEHLHRIVLNENPSSVSPFIVQFDGQRDLVRQHPKIFSSFYTVPNPNYPDLDLSKAISFYDMMTSYYSQAFTNMLEAVQKVADGPIDIFRSWEKWQIEKDPFIRITPDFVFYSFNEFLERYSQDFYRRLETKNEIQLEGMAPMPTRV